MRTMRPASDIAGFHRSGLGSLARSRVSGSDDNCLAATCESPMWMHALTSNPIHIRSCEPIWTFLDGLSRCAWLDHRVHVNLRPRVCSHLFDGRTGGACQDTASVVTCKRMLPPARERLHARKVSRSTMHRSSCADAIDGFMGKPAQTKSQKKAPADRHQIFYLSVGIAFYDESTEP